MYRFLVALFFYFIGFSQELKVAFASDKPPYILLDTLDGIEFQLTKTILNRLGHSMATIQFPYNRLQISPLKYDVDVAVGVMKRDDGLYYSDGLTEYKNVVIVKRKPNRAIKDFNDLFPLKIGAWTNAHSNLGEEFERFTKLKQLKGGYYEYRNQKDQNTAFWRGFVDALIIDYSIFLWYKEILNSEVPNQEAVDVIWLFPQKKFTRVSFKNSRLRDRFNVELQKLRASGDYERIYSQIVRPIN